jgi:hypothetical protein
VAYDEQYDNPKLWQLIGILPGKDYASVPTEEPVVWVRRTLDGGKLAYDCGEYRIIGRLVGKADRRSYTVHRLGYELPLSFYTHLRDAQARAVKNAAGKDRMHLA